MKRSALLAVVFLVAAVARGGAMLPALEPARAAAYAPGPLHSATNAADRTTLTNAVLAVPRRAASAALLFDARPPVPSDCGLAADALVVPACDASLASNRFFHADAALCRAVCWRMRRGVSPPHPPVLDGHGGAAVGWIETGWCDERGMHARIRFASAEAAAVALECRLSPEMLVATGQSVYGDWCAVPLRLRAVAITGDPALPTRWDTGLFRIGEAPPVPSARPAATSAPPAEP